MHAVVSVTVAAFLLLNLDVFGGDNRYKSINGVPILMPPPNDAQMTDALYRAGDTKLLAVLKKFPVEEMPMELVWNNPVPLHDADYQLCIFDTDGHSVFSSVPRVLVLFRRNEYGFKIVTWKKFESPPGFASASIVNAHSRETHLVTVNSIARFGGELLFERFNIDAGGITKLGEGPNPREIGKNTPEAWLGTPGGGMTPLLSEERAREIRYAYPQVFMTLKDALSKLSEVEISRLEISDPHLGRRLCNLQVACTAYVALKKFSESLSDDELNQKGSDIVNSEITKKSVDNLLIKANEYLKSNGMSEGKIEFLLNASDVESKKEVALRRLKWDVPGN